MNNGSKIPQENRFWPKVDICGDDECWEWLAGKDSCGYGRMRGDNETCAHRISWELHNCTIPKGMCIMHTCDNPSCVNPKHLFAGTQSDNIKDMIQKGRYVPTKKLKKGEMSHNAKLSKLQVRSVWYFKLSLKWSQAKIARHYKVSPMVISRLVNNQTHSYMY